MATVSDVVSAINYTVGPSANPVPFAVANGDCIINVTDAVYSIQFIFGGGSEPTPGCQDLADTSGSRR